MPQATAGKLAQLDERNSPRYGQCHQLRHLIPPPSLDNDEGQSRCGNMIFQGKEAKLDLCVAGWLGQGFPKK